MNVTLRPLLHSDIEEATRVGLKSWASAIGPLLQDFSPNEMPRIENAFRGFLFAHLERPLRTTDRLRLAAIEGRIAGFYNLECQPADLTDLWVSPEWHGKGVASALLLDASEFAVKAGHNNMTLELLADNRRAHAFYLKHGFVEYGRKDQQDPILQRKVCKILMRANLCLPAS